MNSTPSNNPPVHRLQPYREPAPATGNQSPARSRWSDKTLIEFEIPANIRAKIEAQQHAQVPASVSSAPPPKPLSASSDDLNRIDLAGGAPDQHDQGEPPPSPSGNGLIKELSVALLLGEPRVETRAKMDENTIEEYAEAMRAGAQFPPIVIFETKVQFWLADGCHRVEATSRASLETIKAEVRKGGRLDAVRFALQANVRHGLRRTNADKRLTVRLALQEFTSESDRAIAELCGVSNVMVGEVRREVLKSNTSTVRKGRDGKHYPAAKASRHKKASEAAVPRPPEQETSTAPCEPMPSPLPGEKGGDFIANLASEAAGGEDQSPTIDPQPQEPLPETCVATSSLESSSSGAAVCTAVAEALPAPPLTTTSTAPKSFAVAGVQAAVDESCLVPSDKMLQAVERVSARDTLPSDERNFPSHVRHMVPRVAALLNEYRRMFPELEGRDLSRALSIANAKLQLVMKWGESLPQTAQGEHRDDAGRVCAPGGGSCGRAGEAAAGRGVNAHRQRPWRTGRPGALATRGGPDAA